MGMPINQTGNQWFAGGIDDMGVWSDHVGAVSARISDAFSLDTHRPVFKQFAGENID